MYYNINEIIVHMVIFYKHLSLFFSKVSVFFFLHLPSLPTSPPTTYVKGSPRPLAVLVIHWKDSQGSAYSCAHELNLLQQKDAKQKSAKGKGTASKIQRKPGASFQEFAPSGVAQDMLNSCRNELWQHMLSVVYQGSSLETQCSKFLLGTGYVGTLCPTCAKIPHSKKDIRYAA